jgi:thymidylate synthase
MPYDSIIPQNIEGESVDELVYKAIRHVELNGRELHSRAGEGVQVYNINFILTDSRQRLHTLRAPISIIYLARELILFSQGSLSADEMAKCSAFWKKIANDEGSVFSNYGYYVFYQTIPDGRTQFEWVIDLLSKRPQSRRAIININQPYHKAEDNKDLPCTIAMQFFIDEGYVHSVVSSRSTDVMTGLPYNMAFFSFINELVTASLLNRGIDVKLGVTIMKSTFAQLYNNRLGLAQEVVGRRSSVSNSEVNTMPPVNVPPIEELSDIYNHTHNSEVFSWLYENARWNE